MDVIAGLDAPCAPGEVFPHVDVLDDYPTWMEMVHRAERQHGGAVDEPAWQVELRARLGPLARSKRLRMVRTVHDPATGRVRFERRELDGRSHSPWVLDVTVRTAGDGSRLEMHLHYGGRLWTGGVMERALAEQIEAGRERLLSRLRDGAA